MPKLVKRTSVKTFTWKAIKASVSKSTLSKIPKKFISYVPITYYSRKAHYILRKKVRPSITLRNRTDQIKPILFIIFCAKEKLIWLKIYFGRKLSQFICTLSLRHFSWILPFYQPNQKSKIWIKESCAFCSSRKIIKSCLAIKQNWK